MNDLSNSANKELVRLLCKTRLGIANVSKEVKGGMPPGRTVPRPSTCSIRCAKWSDGFGFLRTMPAIVVGRLCQTPFGLGIGRLTQSALVFADSEFTRLGIIQASMVRMIAKATDDAIPLTSRRVELPKARFRFLSCGLRPLWIRHPRRPRGCSHRRSNRQ